jgi:hypothetical protein
MRLDRREDTQHHLEVVFVKWMASRAIKENDVVVVGEGRRHRTLAPHRPGDGARIAMLSFLPQLQLSGNPAGAALTAGAGQPLLQASSVGRSSSEVEPKRELRLPLVFGKSDYCGNGVDV